MKGWDPDVQLAIEQAYQSGWREALESRDGPSAADRSVSPQANEPPDGLPMNSDDRCTCGHRRYQHVYHEGPCRPGYRCASRCRRFRRTDDGPDQGAGGRASPEMPTSGVPSGPSSVSDVSAGDCRNCGHGSVDHNHAWVNYDCCVEGCSCEDWSPVPADTHTRDLESWVIDHEESIRILVDALEDIARRTDGHDPGETLAAIHGRVTLALGQYAQRPVGSASAGQEDSDGHS